jgi:low affinity Fe/Cu permease
VPRGKELESDKPIKTSNLFGRFASWASCVLGSQTSFISACLVIAVWALSGPFYHYSNTWQLIINTGTTIITFLMVFLIQNTQNRDSRAINLKLNELIHAIAKAKNQMIDIEKLSDAELDELSAVYEAIRIEAEERHQNRTTRV